MLLFKQFESCKCPITQEVMIKPVTCSDGHTYEEEAIMEVLKRNAISPLTGETLSPNIRVNLALRNTIEEFNKW